MSRDRGLLIVIADGEHARFVRASSKLALHTERVLDSTTAHQRAAVLGADRPGAAFHSHSSVHHALGPRHELQASGKEKFARLVAHEVNVAAARDEFGELVLVAPAHILDTVRNGLEEPAAARIVGVVGKDLIKTPDSDLQPHVGQWVKRAVRQR